MSDLVQLILGVVIMLATMVLIFGVRAGVESVRRNRR